MDLDKITEIIKKEKCVPLFYSRPNKNNEKNTVLIEDGFEFDTEEEKTDFYESMGTILAIAERCGMIFKDDYYHLIEQYIFDDSIKGDEVKNEFSNQ